jgi:hypothetical protein
MHKFYKFFTLTTLALLTIWFVSTLFSKGAEQSVSAQTKQMETCAAQNVFVIEDGTARTVHLVYDFSRSTVSVVQIQKGYNPPEITVKSKPFTQ